MVVSTVNELVAEALFASDVQPSQTCTCTVVQAAVTQTILRYGTDGCAQAVAAEFGDHPDAAVRRMGWVRQTLTNEYPMFAGAWSGPGAAQPAD